MRNVEGLILICTRAKKKKRRKKSVIVKNKRAHAAQSTKRSYSGRASGESLRTGTNLWVANAV